MQPTHGYPNGHPWRPAPPDAAWAEGNEAMRFFVLASLHGSDREKWAAAGRLIDLTGGDAWIDEARDIEDGLAATEIADGGHDGGWADPGMEWA
ncbi:MAG: hypothetical protein M3Q74_06190 [Pseudomonadota bacterium]|nr:hypothetical protein [Pseudomonadota bacterium]